MEATAILDPLGVNPVELDHDSRLSLLESIEHTRSALDAQQQQTLALLAAEGDAEWRAKEWVREEVAAVLSIAPITAAAKLTYAKELVHRLPHTLDRLAGGSITMGHARAMIDAATDLDDIGVVELERRVADKGERQPIGVFRQTVKRALLAIDARRGEDKHRDAAARRRVRMFPVEDGMATIWAYLRAEDAAGLFTAIDAAAHALPGDNAADGVERSMDQKRADVLADLGTLALNDTATTWHGQRPAVQVTVALSTLLGLDEQPGELEGYGPITADHARRIAHDPTSTWRRLVTDSAGHLLHYGRTTYRPPAALRDHVLTEHTTCTYPGCRRRSCNSEIDHVIAWHDDGHTDVENLHPGCKRHHDAKHQTNWAVTKNADGIITWTSPAGRSYETEPTRHPLDTTTDPTDPDPPPF